MVLEIIKILVKSANAPKHKHLLSRMDGDGVSNHPGN